MEGINYANYQWQWLSGSAGGDGGRTFFPYSLAQVGYPLNERPYGAIYYPVAENDTNYIYSARIAKWLS